MIRPSEPKQGPGLVALTSWREQIAEWEPDPGEHIIAWSLTDEEADRRAHIDCLLDVRPLACLEDEKMGPTVVIVWTNQSVYRSGYDEVEGWYFTKTPRNPPDGAGRP